MSRITIARVYKVTDGSALASDITSGSPANGANLGVEAVTDFDPADDGETRYAVIDSEVIGYTDVNEDTDELVNITRGANGSVAASHTAGTFVQKGLTAKREKFADGYIDDDDTLTLGVEIPRFLWPFYQVGARDNDAMELATVEYLDDGTAIIVDAPQEDDGPDGSVALQVVPWSLVGPIAVGVREHQFPIPFSGAVMEARLSLGVNGLADDDVIVDVRIDGTSILGAERVEVAQGDHLSPALPLEVVVTKGQLATLEFENAGTLDPGSDPVFYLLILPGVNALGGRIEVLGLQGDPGVDGADGVITEVQNEGSALTDAPVLNFTGAGVSASSDGSEYTVDIPGGAGVGDVGAHAYRTTAQSINNNTWTAVSLTAESWDTHAFHDNSTNPSRFTIPSGQAGKYEIRCFAGFENNTTGARGIGIYLNGAQKIVDNRQTLATVTNIHTHVCGELDLAVGDYIEMFVFQNSGGALNINGFGGTHYVATTIRRLT